MSESPTQPSGQGYWQLVEEIFHAALEVTVAARAEFVRQRSDGDAAIEKEVAGILEGYDAQERLSPMPETDGRIGERFGAFEIVRKIGEGGMGAVYLGRRHEDFEQQAAIKLIRGSPAAAVLMSQRFRQERQILAGLDHPNIARLLDGGVTAAGQPYLVMEYVEGVRLDQYCTAHGLALRERLELFRKICAAVHFAHQHLVIHRDLKPGNILVNDRGEPKLLDFGIAKVLSEQGSPDQTATMTAELALTPLYASPEQIRGFSCTVASDVYSLGVILYELLAGAGPYAESRSTPAELIAAVITGEPRRPSQAAPEVERAALRGDLDGIAMKSLAKLPEDRYGSVEQFSEDIRRYLEGLPVTAVEGTRLYFARKFVLRHRVAVAGAVLVVWSLVGGLAATLWQARVADRERVLAEQRFSDARKLASYLLFPLYDEVRTLPGSLPVRADMAAQSLEYLDRLAAAKSTDRALRLELAEGYVRLGGVFETPVGSGDSLGNTKKAIESDQKAVALLEPLTRENKDDNRVPQDLARAYLLLGTALNLGGQPDEGVAKLTQAVGILEKLAAATPKDVATRLEAGRAYLGLGDATSGRGGGFIEMATAGQVIALADRAIWHFEGALQIAPEENSPLLGLAQAYNLKGNLQAQSDPRKAFATYHRGLDALGRLAGAVRTTSESQVMEARLDTMIGHCLGQIREFAQAIAVLKNAQEILDRLAAADPKNATIAQRRVNLFYTRAMMEGNWGHDKESIEDYRQAIRVLDGVIAVDPAKQSNRVVRANAQAWVGILLARSGHTAEGAPYTKASLDYFTEIADRPDAAPQNLNEAASALENQPNALLADFRRALDYAQRSDKLAQGKDHGAIFMICQAYEQLGDGAKAMEAVQRGLALLPPPAPGETPSRNRALFEKHLKRVETLIKTGRLPD